MASARAVSDEEKPIQAGVTIATLIQPAKPTLVTMLIVSILLSIWISLRAA
jgi:hypothetical protein